MAAAALLLANPRHHNTTTAIMNNPNSPNNQKKKSKKKKRLLLNPVTMMRLRARGKRGDIREDFSEGDDTSTIDTTKANLRNQQKRPPLAAVEQALPANNHKLLTASNSIERADTKSISSSKQGGKGEGLEVATSLPSLWEQQQHPAGAAEVGPISSMDASHATVNLSQTPRPLSPLTTVSSFGPNASASTTDNAGKKDDSNHTHDSYYYMPQQPLPQSLPPPPLQQRQCSQESYDLKFKVIDTNIHGNTLPGMVIPSPIPPPSDSLNGFAQKHRASSSPQQYTSSSSSSSPPASSLWKELWQRCLMDCYCIANTNANIVEDTTVYSDNSATDGMNNSDRDYEPPSQQSSREHGNRDDDEEQGGYFSFLLPQCAEEDDLSEIIPKLCHQLEASQSIKIRSNALHHLAQLCDREHSYNRIPLVCSTTQFEGSHVDVVPTVCRILLDPSTPLRDYRQALLILSNLTLPVENKAVLLLGPHCDLLLETLYQGLYILLQDPPEPSPPSATKADASKDESISTIMSTNLQQRKLEVHLVCAIFFNLSFLHDGKAKLIHYIPPDAATSTSHRKLDASMAALDNPRSLIRTLERIMMAFQPFVAPALDSPTTSMDGGVSAKKKKRAADTCTVERQALRWTLGMMRNLCHATTDANPTTANPTKKNVHSTTFSQECAQVIGKTQIPQIALALIRYTPCRDHGHWRTQSLEDLALSFLVELALREQEYQSRHQKENPKLVHALHDISCTEYLQPLLQAGAGIHSLRAQAIVRRFDRKTQQQQQEQQQEQSGTKAQEVEWVGAGSPNYNHKRGKDDPYYYYDDKQEASV